MLKTLAKKVALVSFLSLLTSSVWATGQQQELAVGIEEKLGQMVPLDTKFFNEEGQSVELGSYFKKPVVLALVYLNCPGICTPLLNGLSEVVTKLDLKPGEDYEILTISFNPDDSPSLAAKKKKNYLELLDSPSERFPREAWHFLTGKQESIDKVTNAVGFRYKQEGDQFVHAASLFIIAPDGKIIRYLYGTEYLPFDLKLAIAEANKGRPGPTINKMLLMCFGYDPDSRKYVMQTTRLSMAFILVCVLGLAVYLGFSSRKSIKRHQPSENKCEPGEVNNGS